MCPDKHVDVLMGSITICLKRRKVTHPTTRWRRQQQPQHNF
jgi:hypothetical protein